MRFIKCARYENQPVINLIKHEEILYRRCAIGNPILLGPSYQLDAGIHENITWILERVGIEELNLKLNAEAIAPHS